MIKILLHILLITLYLINAYAGECKRVDRVCVEGAGEREIDGYKVYKDCWRYEDAYQCTGFSQNSCKKLREEGCEQYNAICKEKNGEWCVNHEKAFKCSRLEEYTRKETRYRIPTFKDEDLNNKKVIACGEDIRCVDGKCFKKIYDANNDLGEAIAMLRGLKEMQNKSSTQPIRVFAGKEEWCKKKAFGLNNCCKAGKAWVEKAKLSKCRASEKRLAEKKNSGKCIYVGRQKKKVLGVTKHIKHTYCCFDSKLVKEIQEQGRAQLGKDFGTPGDPNCRGLGVKELQSIDFSKIDFSPLVEEILASKKDVEVLRVKGMIQNELRLITEDMQKGEETKIKGQNSKYNEEGIL